MRTINVTTDSKTYRAADQNVRKKMLLTSETGETHRGGNTISGDLDQTVIRIFIGDNGRHRPRVNRMTRRKGPAAAKEIAAMQLKRSFPTSDRFERKHHQLA